MMSNQRSRIMIAQNVYFPYTIYALLRIRPEGGVVIDHRSEIKDHHTLLAANTCDKVFWSV